MSIPLDNINISFIGTVSTGKSTLLNTIFLEKITQCNIKRATMVPNIFIENNYNDISYENIYEKIEKTNFELIQNSENGLINNENYNELIFNVGKLDINIVDDVLVNVYDIPGLNDIRTKKLYYEYLKTNFYKFNLIIFIVDINSGLNTSDESDILKFIIENTIKHLEANNKKIYTMVIVNKADNMQLNENDRLILSGELLDMFEQVEKTINLEFEKNNLQEHLIDIIPLCGIDAYLYRMIKKFGRNYILTLEDILKIGINEMGKKFCKLSFDEQKSKVYDILGDSEFIETMIKLSGFGNFNNKLSNFLNKNSKIIRIDNLLFELKNYDDINNFYDLYYTIYPDDFNKLIKKHFIIYNMIKNIDESIYENKIQNILKRLFNSLQEKFKRYKYNDISTLIEKYSKLEENILKEYFQDFYDPSIHAKILKNYIYDLIIEKYTTGSIIKITDIMKDFEIINLIDIYTKENIARLIDVIIINNELIYKYNNEYDENDLIEIFDNLETLRVNLEEFLRYINLHRIRDNLIEQNHDLLFIKKMLYNKYNEIPLETILGLMIDINKVDAKTIIQGLKDIVLINCDVNIDIYYLKYIQQFIDV